ncbi:MAG: hypothetical protein GY786_09120 [Proteobacteria bacterium]|nr:hypothetical protein [Pseudomonadota bacterium]
MKKTQESQRLEKQNLDDQIEKTKERVKKLRDRLKIPQANLKDSAATSNLKKLEGLNINNQDNRPGFAASFSIQLLI